MEHARTGLRSKVPFDFGKSLSFLCSFPPTRGEQQVERDRFRKAFAHDGDTIVATVSAGDEPSSLACTLSSERALSADSRARAVERVAFQLGLDDDLAGFYAVARNDGAFAPLVDRLFGQRHVKFSPSPFEAVAWSILAQRRPIRQARSAKDSIVEHFGGAIDLDGERLRAFPETAAILDAGVAGLVAVRVDRERAHAIVEAARAFRDVDRRFLVEGEFAEVERWLRAIPRIGEWSAAFVLFRALGRMARLVDTGPIAKAARTLYGVADDRSALARGEAYGHFRGYWAYYLRVGVG